MKIEIICVGKIKEKYFREACDEYIKRIKSFCDISVSEIKDVSISQKPSEKEIENAIRKEGEEILKRVKNDKLIAMCIEGKKFSSVDFAFELKKFQQKSNDKVYFVIGSSHGLSEEVKTRADLKLSMSSMTFAHRLACVMLCEQIYRAFAILNDRKYHK